MSTPLHWTGVVKAIGADEIVINIGGGDEEYPKVGTEVHVFVQDATKAVPAFEPPPAPKLKHDHLSIEVEMKKLPVTILIEVFHKLDALDQAVIEQYAHDVLRMDDPTFHYTNSSVEITGKMSPIFDTGPLASSIRFVLNGGSMMHDHDHDHGTS